MDADARKVLTHLNEMGYRHISGDILKEFMKDLQKLIKYETKMDIEIYKHKTNENVCDILHKSEVTRKPTFNNRQFSSAEKKTNKTDTSVEKDLMRKHMLNKIAFKPHDPVSLYQYYCAEWIKFKNHIPGEADHRQLRQKIRNKITKPRK